jgi:hypothetical protein
MKRTALFGFVIVISFFCVSASVWEGAASVCLNGELPEDGYYVATRSFPRNTVVDVTNLETGQTIRVIVASGLDSPGLLAILSREAAGAIGLNARSIGRIRMSMPSDPVGFSRFTDEPDSSGDPDFDPAAAIATARGSGFDVKQAESAMEKDTAKTKEPAYAEKADSDSSTVVKSDSGSSGAAAPRPPIAPNPAAQDIVDLPESSPPSQAKDSSIKKEPSPVPAPNRGNAAASATAPGTYGYTPDTGNVAQAYPPQAEPPEPPPPPVAPRTPPPQAVPPPVPRQTPPPQAAPPVPPARGQLALVPAEQRPPESAYPGLPPEAEIAPIKRGTAAPPPPQFEGIPEEYIIPPIENRPPPAPVVQREPVMEPIIPPIARPERSPPPEVITEVTVVEANPARPLPPPPLPAPTASSGEVNFSVPRISSLERGKYYLQLAAYSIPELVETELRKISTIYPLAVQESGHSGRPLYRILVGPVNLGESGALLQRFKVSGYRDAFIRKEG